VSRAVAAAGPLDFCFEWNAENQLTRVTKNAVEMATFKYDPLGRRVEKVAGGVTTSFTYDGQAILRHVAGATTTRFVQGPGIDEPLAKEDAGSGTLSYYHADALGSIAKLTDQAGAVVHSYQYDAWGNIQAGETLPGPAFTGREWDPETGLYYYRARYYDPHLGRFISEDPIGFMGGVNFYTYVRNRPTVWMDPFGLQAGPGLGPVWDLYSFYMYWDYAYRRPGHERFPGANNPNAFIRHCVISCEAAQNEGSGTARGAGAANEIQGFVFIDIPQVMRGGRVTAFGFDDLFANEVGIACSEKAGQPDCEEACVEAARRAGHLPPRSRR
jgi:RHS repeat-associated protein